MNNICNKQIRSMIQPERNELYVAYATIKSVRDRTGYSVIMSRLELELIQVLMWLVRSLGAFCLHDLSQDVDILGQMPRVQ